MEFLSARGAYELSNGTKNKFFLSIMENIEKEADGGQTYLHIYNKLPEPIIDKLKALGYSVNIIVEFPARKNISYFSISWDLKDEIKNRICK